MGYNQIIIINRVIQSNQDNSIQIINTDSF